MSNLKVTNLRPISPHLTVYAPQMSSMLSVFHRIAGVCLALLLVGSLVLSKVLKLSYTEPVLFDLVSYFSVSGSFILWGLLFFMMTVFSFHFANGLRHFVWDGGIKMDKASITGTGVVVLVLMLCSLCALFAQFVV